MKHNPREGHVFKDAAPKVSASEAQVLPVAVDRSTGLSGLAPRFDRTSYQRLYMRRRRALEGTGRAVEKGLACLWPK